MKIRFYRWFNIAIAFPFAVVTVFLVMLGLYYMSLVFISISVAIICSVIVGKNIYPLFFKLQKVRRLSEYTEMKGIDDFEEKSQLDKVAISGKIENNDDHTTATPVTGSEEPAFSYSIERKTDLSDSFTSILSEFYYENPLPLKMRNGSIGIDFSGKEVYLIDGEENISPDITIKNQISLKSIQNTEEYNSVGEILEKFDDSHYSTPDIGSDEEYKFKEAIPPENVNIRGSFEYTSPGVLKVTSDIVFIERGSYSECLQKAKREYRWKRNLVAIFGFIFIVSLLYAIL